MYLKWQTLKDPQVLVLPRGRIVNLPYSPRGQQLNNNSRKSVTASSTPSKAPKKTTERKSRQNSYKGKFSRPHMIIPEQDSEFIETQKPSVMKLWLQCWRCDPYGSRWQVLNHSLKPSSFSVGKKILSDAGLFAFKSERSIRDGRETVCWLVINLHGSRRNDYWLQSTNLESNSVDCNSTNMDSESTKMAIESTNMDSISIETQSQQGFQNPSETSQEHLSNSSKELLEVLLVDPWDDDRDRSSALNGQAAFASPPNENTSESNSDLATKSNQKSIQASQTQRQNSQPLNKKSTVLEEDYEFDWRSGRAAERAVNQISAIKAQETTEEYQNKSKEAFARIRAFFEAEKQIKQSDRESRLRGDNPIARNRPASKDYNDDW